MISQILKEEMNLLADLPDNKNGRGIARPVILAALAGISIFFSVLFIVSPEASSQKYIGGAAFIKAPLKADLKKEAPADPKPDTNYVSVAQSRRYDFKLTGNDTFYGVVTLFNVPGHEVNAIITRARQIYDLRMLRAGSILRIYATGGKFDGFEYRFGDFETLSVKKDASREGGYKVERVELPHETRTGRVTGAIENSLYEDGLKAGLDAQGIMNLSDIFAWDVDFASDIRKGDTFSVLYETLYVEGKPVRSGRVLGAEMVNEGRRFNAIYYEDASGKGGYYDTDGRSLRRTLLKSPLRFSRITSYFSKSRFHPILKQYRPHHGIDYAAPTGTPVEASGGGRVIYAGWKSGYGNFVEIKHNNSYITGYGHLSRIRRGIRVGSSVEQGEVVGYVGSTGISTGPHLHYEVRQNHALINPLRIKAEPNKAVAKGEMQRFAYVRDETMRKLSVSTVAVASKGASPTQNKALN